MQRIYKDLANELGDVYEYTTNNSSSRKNISNNTIQTQSFCIHHENDEINTLHRCCGTDCFLFQRIDELTRVYINRFNCSNDGICFTAFSASKKQKTLFVFSDKEDNYVKTFDEIHFSKHEKKKEHIDVALKAEKQHKYNVTIDKEIDCRSEKLYVGENYSLMLNSDNELYMCGGTVWDKKKQSVKDLCLNTKESCYHILNNLKIHGYDSNCRFVVCIDSKGDLYVFGVGNEGELGRGPLNIVSFAPKIVHFPSDVKVTKAACGEQHVLCICENNNLYSWGSNMFGQCGISIKGINQIFTPQKVCICNNHNTKCLLNCFKVTEITAGYGHSLCICEDGSLYGWGLNNCHQLFVKTPKIISYIPLNIHLNYERNVNNHNKGDIILSKVMAFNNTSVLLNNIGDVWVYGSLINTSSYSVKRKAVYSKSYLHENTHHSSPSECVQSQTDKGEISIQNNAVKNIFVDLYIHIRWC